MPDVYATITEADPAVVAQLADILELRAADPQQRELRDAYLADLPFDGSRVAEIGGDVSYVEGDGRELPLADGSLDVVVLHTTLCHIPGPERALAEALRVLRPGGRLAVFDGDYATTTMSTGPFDPLQACADAVVDFLVHDPYLVRSLPRLAGACSCAATPWSESGGSARSAARSSTTSIWRGASRGSARRSGSP